MRFRRSLKYLFFVGFIGVLSFLYGFTSTRSGVKKIVEVRVSFQENKGNFLTHAMVNKLLIQNNKTVINQPKSVIDLYSLEKKVSENPYVEKAAVFLTIGGVLKSKIKQRVPVARIMGGKTSYYIDKQGVKVPLSENYSARVLLISGVESTADIQLVLPLISAILEDDFLQKEVVGILKSDVDAFQFSVRSGDYKVDFGSLERLKTKFSMLKAFYNTTFKNKTIQDYKRITLKYHNQVVCTK
ncbi:cell division protein FtsQ [uncultured Polaribacter sp.]|uniref:cell division protein FtsQ/DivIB n=1 Tax=uncultured Polaribacter sp. TaxID=174711 RepID=UPI000A42980E|nr:cell division protein FtsQ [Polaribacter sp.]|tara:strand:+ start:1095 stop:1820 length:726 start_codon:yes stop_codon:yes gene_type:complete